MQTSARFGAKNNGFFEIYGVSARTGGREVEPVRTFCGQEGRGQFFAILCGCSLWTLPIRLASLISSFVVDSASACKYY